MTGVWFGPIVVCLYWFSIDRDGVSEGQFSQVLLYEMDAIRKVQ